LLLLIVAVLVLADATGVWAMVAPATCTQSCARTGESDDCGANCAACACCGHAKPALLAAGVGIPATSVHRLQCEPAPSARSAPNPADIFHVPIPFPT
jgi:hypothetical protein